MKSMIQLASMFTLSAALHNEFDGQGGGGSMAEAPTVIDMQDMTPNEIRILGVSGIKHAQPSTVEKYDALAKQAGRCLADAVSKQYFHGTYGDIRAAVTKMLIKGGHGRPQLYVIAGAKKIVVEEQLEGEGDAAKVTGYTDGKKTYKADADISVEADNAFFTRLCTALDEAEGTTKGAERFRDIIQKAANENPFDPSRKQRTAGPRKIAKSYIEAAQSIIDAGAEVIAGAVAQISELLDRQIDVSDPETRLQVLATAIADNELREKREREAKTKEKYLSFGQA